MEREESLQEKNFVELPSWFQSVETYYRPMMENQLNQIKVDLLDKADETLVRDEGIELAIQQFGLSAKQPVQGPEPSGSTVPEKKMKVSDDNQSQSHCVLISAIESAIANKGLSFDRFS